MSIEHKAQIIKIRNNQLTVKIIDLSSCHDCQAEGSCGVEGIGDGTMEVPYVHKAYKVGDIITLVFTSSFGLLSVLLAFVLPLILLLCTLILSSLIIESEKFLALISLFIIMPYYAMLYLFRHKFEKKIIPYIK